MAELVLKADFISFILFPSHYLFSMSASSRLAHEQTIIHPLLLYTRVYGVEPSSLSYTTSSSASPMAWTAASFFPSFTTSLANQKHSRGLLACVCGSWWDLRELELEILRVEPVALGRRIALLGCASISNCNRYKCLRLDLLVPQIKHYFLTLYIFLNNSARAHFYLQFSLSENVF